MSRPKANTSISLSARLALYLGPPATVLFISTSSPRAGLVTPLAFLPAAGLYKVYSKAISKDPSRRANLEPLIWTVVVSATAGVAAAAAVQIATSYSFATALFGNGETRNFFVKQALLATTDDLSIDDIARRAVLATSWQNTLFNALFSFVGAGITEEMLKYSAVAYSRRCLKNADDNIKRRSRASLDYALAWGLGLGLVEAIGGLYTSATDPQFTWPKLALTVFERLILGASAHLITAALSGLRSIRRDQTSPEPCSRRNLSTVLSIIGPSVFLHGANNFGLFEFSAWNGNLGFIHPRNLGQNLAMLGMYLTALGTAAGLARREWRAITENERKQE